MILNRNTILPAAPAAKPVQYALKALRRDFDRVFTDTAAPGGRILLTINDTLPAEQYTLTVDADTLLLSAADDLGFVYGLFEINAPRFSGVSYWGSSSQKGLSPCPRKPMFQITRISFCASIPACHKARNFSGYLLYIGSKSG